MTTDERLYVLDLKDQLKFARQQIKELKEEIRKLQNPEEEAKTGFDKLKTSNINT
tara:strand:- start:3517 stop:3681 length:165 start_codon:yes stop_codon:yes gene_type:complete